MNQDHVFDKVEGAYALAILYTLGYIIMVGMLMFVDIPKNNRELLISLVSIMSAIQLAIIKYYYDGSKGAEKAQQASSERGARTDSVLQEIAKAAPAAVIIPPVAPAAGEPAAP